MSGSGASRCQINLSSLADRRVQTRTWCWYMSMTRRPASTVRAGNSRVVWQNSQFIEASLPWLFVRPSAPGHCPVCRPTSSSSSLAMSSFFNFHGRLETSDHRLGPDRWPDRTRPSRAGPSQGRPGRAKAELDPTMLTHV